MMTKRSSVPVEAIGLSLAMAALPVMLSGSAAAQTPADPDPGALTFTGGLDFPSIYFFRGIRQETELAPHVLAMDGHGSSAGLTGR